MFNTQILVLSAVCGISCNLFAALFNWTRIAASLCICTRVCIWLISAGAAPKRWNKRIIINLFQLCKCASALPRWYLVPAGGRRARPSAEVNHAVRLWADYVQGLHNAKQQSVDWWQHMWNISCSPKIHDAFAQLGAVSYDGAIKQ